MAIILHNAHPFKKGYYSKIRGRKLVTQEVGAQNCEMWEQIIPPDGYIMPHYHNFEETITLLTGSVKAHIDGIIELVTAPATLFIPPYTIHSLTNLHDEPVHLFAFLATNEAWIFYPEGTTLTPVIWEDEP